MNKKIILFLFLVSYLGLSSCSKGSKPTVSFINKLIEESRTQAEDGSYINSHFLNVDIIKLHNERKLKPTEVLAELKLYHLTGFKKQFVNAADVKYRRFEGDSSETVYPLKDSALMVQVGFNATITDKDGNKVVVVKDMLVPTMDSASTFPNVANTANVNGNCISVSEHISSKFTISTNTYYKNVNIFILNNPSVFKKDQKYKLHFRVFDKQDPNRYFEGETPFKAY